LPSATPPPNIVGMDATDDPESLHARLHELRVEHRELDALIAGQLDLSAPRDELTLRRLKKRKLHIKDLITRIETMLEPDIPA
jgi:hypothetical protein